MDLEKYTQHVPGEDRGKVLLFAISTCGWCQKTKGLLRNLGIDFKYIDVDLLDGVARDEVMKEVSRWNERRSFPTLVVNDRSIVGFQEEKTREELGSGSR